MSGGKIITIANQKGGVGKTSTALNFSYSLSQSGKKVLLVDFDPQANLTMCFGVDKPDELKTTIYHLMSAAIEEEELPDKSEYLISNNGIDLIPCSIELSAIEVNLVNTMSRENILSSILEDLRQDYDYIIIDCMPSLGMLTINALTACDSVLITATPEYLSAKGLELLLKTIIRVKKKLNPRITIDGILITMYRERTIISREILSLIEDAYGNSLKVFESKIPSSVKVGEANFNNKSIIEYKPDNKVTLAYNDFAKEYVGL